MGPLSKKVIDALKKAKNSKIINFSEIKAAKAYAQELDKTVVTKDDLSKYDPLHAVYVYGQNKISVFVEQLSGLPVLSKLTTILTQAEDIYLPSFPPKSPLTTSYFSCWGFFDLCIGIQKESFGTVILDLLKHLKADPGLIKIVEEMQRSRMGIFIHKGFLDRYVMLEELVTGNEFKTIVPSGYQGKKDEIWFVRVLPEPFPELNYGYSLVLTTPYILTEIINNQIRPAKINDWMDFFDRNLKKSREKDEANAYEAFMKYGPVRHSWNEYIFEGYVNYKNEMIMLTGFPDIPLTLPHSKESQKQRGEI